MRINCCLLTLLLGLSLSAQTSYFSDVQNIGMEEGLSHYSVLSLHSTDKGMWIGTEDGLNFYDGFNWKYWKKEDQKLRFQSVDFILEDQSERLWLFNCLHKRQKTLTQAIDILDPNDHKSVPLETFFGGTLPFKIEDIKQYFGDDQNRIYLFAAQQLWRYSLDSLVEIPLPQGFEPIHKFPGGPFAGIQNDTIVLVSADGHFLKSLDYPIANKRMINIRGRIQNFMVSQQANDCFQFVQKNSNDYDFKKSLFKIDEDHFTFVLEYDESKKWFWALSDAIVYLVDQQQKILLKHDAYTRTTCLDEKGNLWNASGAVNINIIKPIQQKFRRFLRNDPSVTKIKDYYRCRGMVEKDGFLYINTYLGPHKINIKTGDYSHIQLPGRKRKFVVFKDQKENIWFANRNLHLWDENAHKVISIIKNENKTSKRNWCAIEDQYQNFWLGNDGLSYVEGDKIIAFQKYNKFKLLEGAITIDLFKDKNGVIWVMSNNGLYILDPKKGIIQGFGKHWEGDNYLPSNKFHHMYQDAEGTYWLSTEDMGVIRWDKASRQWKVYNQDHGFLSNNIYAVYEDQFGYLWMSSFNGLIRMNKQTEEIIIFNEKDGICQNEFNRISHLQLEDGTIFFGGQNGVTSFHPKDFLTNPSNQDTLQLSIDHVSIFGAKTLMDTLSNGEPIDLINLPPGTRVIDLELKSSDLFWSAELSFHYTLERLNHSNDETMEVSREKISSDNHVELFGMTPGNYIINIKAITEGGKQIGRDLKIPLKINHPLSNHPAFQLSIVALLGICIWGFLKYRTARLKAHKVKLERLVKERTAQILKDQKTILAQATQITEMQEQLDKKDELWLKQLHEIISENLQDSNLDLPLIIENLDIGRSQFFEKVKSLTNMTPNQYIQELRLGKAKEILESGDVKTVKEVAYAVGIKRPVLF